MADTLEKLTERAREWLASAYPGKAYEQMRRNSPDLLAAFAGELLEEAAKIAEDETCGSCLTAARRIRQLAGKG